MVDAVNASAATKLDKSTSWDLLHDELLAYDRRRGSVSPSISLTSNPIKPSQDTRNQNPISTRKM